MRGGVAAVVAVVAAGCGSGEASPADARPADAGAPPADARPTQTVATAATHGTIEVPFGVTVHGSSAAVRVSLDGNVGTVAVGSRPAAPALAYGFSQFPGYNVYQVLAVEPDRWVIAFVYCQGSRFTYVYYEDSLGGGLSAQPATGTCSGLGAGSVAVDFPAFSLSLDGATPQFSIDGPQISRAAGAPGTMLLGGRAVTFFPISVVDCTMVCGTSGWWELHVVLWDQAAAKACFGILYLFLDPGPLLLTYTLTLPDLSDPSGGQTFFGAIWSL